MRVQTEAVYRGSCATTIRTSETTTAPNTMDFHSNGLDSSQKTTNNNDENSPEILETALKNLSPRWKNWTIRTIFTLIMLIGFCYLMYLGPLALIGLIVLILVKIFHEIISIGFNAFEAKHFPYIQFIVWYYFLLNMYYYLGELFYDKFKLKLSNDYFFCLLIDYHKFVLFLISNC